jgi:hypothetical protein
MLRKRLPGELPQGPAWKKIVQITNSKATFPLTLL